MIPTNFFKLKGGFFLVKSYLLAILAFCIIIPTASAEVFVKNDQKFMDSSDSMHIVGEIQNDLQSALNQVKLDITLYNSEGKIIDKKTTKSLVNTIMPTMRSPFNLVIPPIQSQDVDSYSIDLDYNIIVPKSQVIDVVSSEISQDRFNNYVINGKITNNGETTANAISVVATMYGDGGKVIAVSKDNIEPDYLRADHAIPFILPVHDLKERQTIKDYSIVAESEEYAAVPEFPIGSMILLAGSVSSYIVLTRYSGKAIANCICAANPK